MQSLLDARAAYRKVLLAPRVEGGRKVLSSEKAELAALRKKWMQSCAVVSRKAGVSWRRLGRGFDLVEREGEQQLLLCAVLKSYGHPAFVSKMRAGPLV